MQILFMSKKLTPPCYFYARKQNKILFTYFPTKTYFLYHLAKTSISLSITKFDKPKKNFADFPAGVLVSCVRMRDVCDVCVRMRAGARALGRCVRGVHIMYTGTVRILPP